MGGGHFWSISMTLDIPLRDAIREYKTRKIQWKQNNLSFSSTIHGTCLYTTSNVSS
jgi:hypothetical protein